MVHAVTTLVSRTHTEQRELGRFLRLWAETDKPSGTLHDIAARVAGVVRAEVLAYIEDRATGDRRSAVRCTAVDAGFGVDFRLHAGGAK